MTLTNEQIFNAVNALIQLAQREHMAISQMAKYRLKKQYDTLKKSYEELVKIQQELTVKHGQEVFMDPPQNTQSSGQFSIHPSKQKDFDAEWQPLLQETQEFPGLLPLTAKLVGDNPNGIELRQLILLGPLAEDPKEEEA